MRVDEGGRFLFEFEPTGLVFDPDHPAALESVSLVVPFDEDTALEVVRQARPAIYAKGGDYDMTAIPEGQAVLAYGGQAVAIDFAHDRSTTRLLHKVRSGN